MEFLKDLFGPGLFEKVTQEQKACSHILSSRMADGKYFCPSCKLTSTFPLKRDR